MKWAHDHLQEDLAGHLRGTRDRVVWTNMQMGPSGSPRPDVYTIPKSYSRFTPLAYEIKISVADFRRDVTSGKWQSYLKFAAGVIFAVPAGLIKKEDVPPGCGLIVRHEEIWRTVKGPTLKATENLPLSAWMKLMIDGLNRQAHDPQPRTANQWSVQQTIRKLYGDKIGAALYDLDLAEQHLAAETLKAQRTTEDLRAMEDERLKHARANAERELKETLSAKVELCRALGLPENASIYMIAGAASKAATRLSGDGEVQRLTTQLANARRALDEALAPLPTLTAAEVQPTVDQVRTA